MKSINITFVKKEFSTLSVAAFVAFVLSGCTIQKRVHLPGYYISTRSNSECLQQNKASVALSATFNEDCFGCNSIPSPLVPINASMINGSPRGHFVKSIVPQGNGLVPMPNSESLSEFSEEFSVGRIVNLENEEKTLVAQQVSLQNTVGLDGISNSGQDSRLSSLKVKVLGNFKLFASGLHSRFFSEEPTSDKTDGLSIAAMCCGIFGLVVFGFGILGIVFGSIGLAKTKKNGTKGKGMAITGLITGIAKVLLIIALL